MFIISLDVISITIDPSTLTNVINILIPLLIAAVIGLIAEYVLGWDVPLGAIGATIVALIGIWVMTNIVTINGIGDIIVYGIPLIRAFIGAVLLVAIVHYFRLFMEKRAKV